MADLGKILNQAIEPALALLPAAMGKTPAKIQLLAIGLQESGFTHRLQVGGPARGFWQFESGGGVKGVMTHAASQAHAQAICASRGVAFERQAIYQAIATDDVLAAAFARLLLWTDPLSIPSTEQGCWDLYARTWRPGKPHPEKWPDNYRKATQAVMG